MKKRFTDIHHHILYGLDDGAANKDKMYAMLHKAAEDRIARIVATPHITPGMGVFNAGQFQRALDEARRYCREEGLALEIHEGAEILYTAQTCGYLLDGRVPTMAGTDSVLVEFLPDVRFSELMEALENLLHCGYVPIVAHVERYGCLFRHPSRAKRIKDDMDVHFQVNCSSVLGNHNGMGNLRFVEKLLDWDLVDAVATDAHSANMRSVHMTQTWRKLKAEFGVEYANELTDGHLLFQKPARPSV